MYRGAQVKGTLTDRDGKPVEAMVQLVPDGIDMSIAVDEQPGSFTAENVRAGTYTLAASGAQTLDGRAVTIHPRRVELPPTGTVTFALTESAGSGTMRLGLRMPPLPPDGEQEPAPPEEAVAPAHSAGRPRSQRIRAITYKALLEGTVPATLSAEQLRFRLRVGGIRASTQSHAETAVYENLPGGPYTFVVLVQEEGRPPRYSVHREPLFLTEGETLERDLQVTLRPLP